MSGRISNAFQSDTLKLFYQNTAFANVGNAGGLGASSVAGSFFIALYTADPGAGGTMSTNEAGYTGYARQTVARSSAGWTITGSSPTIAENAAAITFPQSSTSETETNAGMGLASGASELGWNGPLAANLAVANLITPQFSINAFQNTLD